MSTTARDVLFPPVLKHELIEVGGAAISTACLHKDRAGNTAVREKSLFHSTVMCDRV